MNFIFFKHLNSFIATCDSSQVWGTVLSPSLAVLPQFPATPIAEGMISFHHFIMFVLIIIGVMVLYLLIVNVVKFWEFVHSTPQKFTHSSELEIGWTLFPGIILLIIAIPSFSLLYSLDDLIDPAITVKIIGHQWYWSYEYSDYSQWKNSGYTIAFDSYLYSFAGEGKKKF
jgi:heme/copper-type cytochrome/quinol oxidase subunit 2